MASRSQARLRKAFRYPDDDEDDSRIEPLDEEEQDELIATLKANEQRMNTIFSQLFTLFPLLLILVYLPPTYSKFGGSGRNIPMLAISSLICTAWTMQYVPTGRTGIAYLDKVIADLKDPASEKVKGKRRAVPASTMSPFGSNEGPVQKFLPLMNACLALLVLVTGYLGAGTRRGGFSTAVVAGTPLFSVVMIALAKIMLGGVGVEELEGLRYGYKGA